MAGEGAVGGAEQEGPCLLPAYSHVGAAVAVPVPHHGQVGGAPERDRRRARSVVGVGGELEPAEAGVSPEHRHLRDTVTVPVARQRNVCAVARPQRSPEDDRGAADQERLDVTTDTLLVVQVRPAHASRGADPTQWRPLVDHLPGHHPLRQQVRVEGGGPVGVLDLHPAAVAARPGVLHAGDASGRRRDDELAEVRAAVEVDRVRAR